MKKYFFLFAILFGLAGNAWGQSNKLNIQVKPVSCADGSDGEITVTVSNVSVAYPILVTLTRSGMSPQQLNINSASESAVFPDLPPSGTASYSVRVQKGSSILAQQSNIAITNPVPLSKPREPEESVNCDSEGSIKAYISGGTKPYTYTLSGSASESQTTSAENYTFTGLNPGTYDLSITDANGCGPLVSSGLVIVPYVGMTGSTIVEDAVCFDTETGAVTINVSGGIASNGYSYILNGDLFYWQIDNIYDHLGKGDYFVLVLDDMSCELPLDFTIGEPAELVVAQPTITHITSCNGRNEGKITLSATGGTAPYKYSIGGPENHSDNNGGPTITFENLPAGTYQVSVTDANDCNPFQTSVTINQPDPVTFQTDFEDNNCAGGSEGTITVTNPTGGNGSYQYKLDGPVSYVYQADPKFSSLIEGTYTVTMKDGNGCESDPQQVTLTDPEPITATEMHTDVTCNNLTDGTISITASGGTGAGWSYIIAPAAGTLAGNTFSNLPADTYTVTVKDGNGCEKDIKDIEIVNPPLIDFTPVPTHVACNGDANGAITITGITGGTGAILFKVEKAGVLISDFSDITVYENLSAGTYTVTAKDAKNCEVPEDVTIDEPAELTVAEDPAQHKDVQCYEGTDGTAGVTVSGGTLPYTYAWYKDGVLVPTLTGISATNLGGGTYTVTVTDGNGCEESATIVITPALPISANVVLTDVTCNGANDGTATANPSGGNGPAYTFQWDGVAGTATQTGLTPAPVTHTLRVYDITGVCFIDTTFSLAQPPALNISPSVTNVNCYDQPTGAITLTVTGGTSGYTVAWTGPDGFLSDQLAISNLKAGTYHYRVEDANGCFDEKDVTVSQNPDLTVVFDPDHTTSVICFDDNSGHATVVAGGGVAPYQYAWYRNGVLIPEFTGPSATGLGGGRYTVTVTDDTGCTDTSDEMTITPADPLVFVVDDLKNATCFERADGTITVHATGGTAPYGAYQWEHDGNDNYAAGQTIAGLVAGNYTVSITDANGCTADSTIRVVEPSELNVSVTKDADISCKGSNNGRATAVATGGEIPGGGAVTYEYLWSPSGETTAAAVNLRPGANTVTVTVTGGDDTCFETGNVTIAEPSEIDITSVIAAKNPLECFGDTTHVTIFATGDNSRTLEYALNEGQFQSSNKFTELPIGTYKAKVRYAGDNACMAVTEDDEDLVITQSSQLTIKEIAASHADVTCNGGNNGQAEVAAENGTSPYGYLWYRSGSDTPIPGKDQALATDLTAGVYVAEVTDDNGCKAKVNVTVGEASLVLVTTVITDITCFGANDGTVTLMPSDGNGAPYTYVLDGAAPIAIPANGIVGGLTPNHHTVEVFDKDGCSSGINNINIIEPTEIEVSLLSKTDASCHNDGDGSATVSVAGGSGNYTYVWKDGSSNTVSTANPAENLYAGTYTVTVSDAAHPTCSAAPFSVTIDEPAEITVAPPIATTDNLDCSGAFTTLTIRAKGEPGKAMLFSTDGNIWQNDSVFVVGAGIYSAWAKYDGAAECTQQSTGTTEIKARAAIVLGTPDVNPPVLDCNVPGQKATVTVNIASSESGADLQYSIDGNTWQNSPVFANLGAGTYTLRVKYATGSGCEETTSVTVASNATITITGIAADPQALDCSGGTSRVTVTADGDGHADLEYRFDGGAWQDDNFTDITIAATRNVVAEVRYKGENCPVSRSIEITAPAALHITQVNYPTSVDCYDQKATVTIVATEVPGREFSLYDGVWQDGNIFNNVPADIYTARVRYKATGACEDTYPVNISQPAELKIIDAKADKKNLDCADDLTAIRIHATGDPFRTMQFSINGGTTWQTDSVFTGIAASATPYHAKVRYAAPAPACEADGGTITVTAPAPIIYGNAVPGSPAIDCGNTTTIEVTATGDGARTLEFSINDGVDYYANGGNFSDVGTGIYKVWVRYAAPYDMCTLQGNTVTINSTDVLNVSIAADDTDLDCDGETTIRANATNVDISKTLLYRLNNGDWLESPIFEHIPGGVYIVEVAYEGSESCPQPSNSVTINQNRPIGVTGVTINGIAVDRLYLDCFNSTAVVQVTATGSDVLQFELSGNSTFPWQDSPVFNGVTPGTYTVKVRYKNGAYSCEQVYAQKIGISRPEVLTIIDVRVDNENLACFGDSTMLHIDATGDKNRIIEYSLDGVKWQTAKDFKVGANPAGYTGYARYTESSCEMTKQSKPVIAPAKIIVDALPDKNSVTCDGADKAIITITASGEPGRDLEYSADGISWFPNDNTIEVFSGQYTVRVRYADTHTCEVRDTKAIKIDGTNDIQFISVVPAVNQVSCHGDSTSITATASYDHAKTLEMSIDGSDWKEAAGGVYTFPKVAAGVTVYVSARYSDDHNCVKTSDAILIHQPDLLEVSLIGNPVNASGCFSETAGSAEIRVIGGSGKYRYQVDGAGAWIDFNGSSTTVGGLTEGTHTIAVLDDKGCKPLAPLTVTITNPDIMQISTKVMNVRCFGESNGSITINVIHGRAPYTITVNGQTYNSAVKGLPIVVDGLAGGTYPVKVVDAAGCERTEYPIVRRPIKLELTISCIQHICPGGTTGTILKNQTGGWDPVNIEWYRNNVPLPLPLPSPDELEAGDYKLIAIDYAQCTDTVEVTLYKLTDLTYGGTRKHDVKCQNATSGSVVILNPGGGAVGPYEFRVLNANTNSVISGFDWRTWENDSIFGLAQGNYTVEMRDVVAVEACEPSQICPSLPIPVTIGTENGLAVDPIVIEPLCSYSNDGKITGITFTGSNSPSAPEYMLRYPNGGEIGWQNTAVFDTLSVGDYTLFVREKEGTGDGCSTMKPFTVAGPPQLIIDNIAVNDPGCEKTPQGFIEFDVMGGTGNLAVTYNGKVLTGTQSDPAINEWHYKYDLTKGGWAEIKVTDINGCSDTAMRKIPYTTDLEIAKVRIVPNECPGDRAAEVHVIAHDILGAPHGMFTYVLYKGMTTDGSNVVGDSLKITNLTDTAVFKGLDNGTYTVSVFDDRTPTPCYTLDSVIVVANKYNIEIINTDTIPNKCPGKDNGIFLCTIVGDPSYTYYEYELNHDPSTRARIDDVNSGIADVTILDLASGVYTITFYYGNCSIDQSFEIKSASSVIPKSIVPFAATGCSGSATGSIKITMPNLSGRPYGYTVTGPTNKSGSFSTTETTVTGLLPGEYVVIVQTREGCQSDPRTITVPDVKPMTITYTPLLEAMCVGKSDGQIGIKIADGVAPYTIVTIEQPDYAGVPEPKPGDGTYDAIIDKVTGGKYKFTISDARNCFPPEVLELDIVAPVAVTIDVTHTDQVCDVDGKPVDASITVKVTAPASGSFEYKVNEEVRGPMPDTEQIFGGLIEGVYQVRVTEQTDFCLAETYVTIKGTTAPDVSFNPTQPMVSCHGVNDGRFSFVINTPGDYRYQLLTSIGTVEPAAWRDGSSGSYTLLGAGDYKLAVNDKISNCSWEIPVTVSSPPELKFDVVRKDIPLSDCLFNVTLTVVPESGASPFKYYMDGHMQPDPVFNNVTPGNHNFSIADAYGCIGGSALNYPVTLPDPITVTPTIIDVTCNMDGTGSIVLSPPDTYTYRWDDGPTGHVRDHLNAGTYGVEITNKDGNCIIHEEYKVAATYSIDVNIIVEGAVPDTDGKYNFCSAEQIVLHGTVVINDVPYASGSSAVANWVLPSGEIVPFEANTPLVTKAASGAIQLIVTSGNCTTAKSVDITLKSAPTVVLGADSVYIPKDEKYQLNVDASSANGYTYLWTSIPEGFAAGLPAPPAPVTLEYPDRPNYTLILTLTDNNSGCSSADSVFVAQAEIFFIPNAFTPNDDGIHDKWIFTHLEQYASYYSVDVAVFNRAGIQVYEGKGYNNSSVVFDGRRNGNDLPIGTYYYVVKVGPHTFKGSVTIIR